MLRRILAAMAAVVLGVGLAVVAGAPALAALPVGPYSIKAQGSNKCMDVTGVSYANGAFIQMYDCLGGAQYNQVFYLVAVPGQPYVYQIKPSHSLKCLDIVGVSQDPGARVQQWDCLGVGQTNQLFYVFDNYPGYTIEPKHSFQEVTWQGLFNGAAVFQWPNAGARWTLV